MTTRAGLVNTVMTGLTGCEVGSDCSHGEGVGEVGAQKWMNRVIYELRKMGVCAGQHIAGDVELRRRAAALKPGKRALAAGTDEIAVAQGACDGPWEGYKIANYGGGKVIWAIEGAGEGPPGANRRSWTPKSGCSTPGPGPTPVACPIPPPGENWAYDLKPHGGMLLDASAYVGNPTHTKDVPWRGCGVNRCPLSYEKGPLAKACSLLMFGDPIWEVEPGSGTCTVFPPDENSLMTVRVSSGSCKLSMRGTKGSPQSQKWSVFASVPACDVAPSGLCQ